MFVDFPFAKNAIKYLIDPRLFSISNSYFTILASSFLSFIMSELIRDTVIGYFLRFLSGNKLQNMITQCNRAHDTLQGHGLPATNFLVTKSAG